MDGPIVERGPSWPMIGVIAVFCSFLAFGASVYSQAQNIVTMYGCLTATSATCTGLQPVAVDSSGNIKVKFTGNINNPTIVGNLTFSPGDVVLRRSAAKTLTVDTDGAGGLLTAISLDATQVNINGLLASSGGNLTLQGQGVNNLVIGGGLVAFNNSKVSAYNGVTSAGWGVPAIYAAANITAQSSNATITSYVNGAADGDFEVSGQVNVTVSTVTSTTLTVTYTDVSNTTRTMILPIQQLAGSFIAAGAITGVGSWESPVMHIRAKASTTITILTSAGTFTGVTYSASGVIRQLQ